MHNGLHGTTATEETDGAEFKELVGSLFVHTVDFNWQGVKFRYMKRLFIALPSTVGWRWLRGKGTQK